MDQTTLRIKSQYILNKYENLVIFPKKIKFISKWKNLYLSQCGNPILPFPTKKKKMKTLFLQLCQPNIQNTCFYRTLEVKPVELEHKLMKFYFLFTNLCTFT